MKLDGQKTRADFLFKRPWTFNWLTVCFASKDLHRPGCKWSSFDASHRSIWYKTVHCHDLNFYKLAVTYSNLLYQAKPTRAKLGLVSSSKLQLKKIFYPFPFPNWSAKYVAIGIESVNFISPWTKHGTVPFGLISIYGDFLCSPPARSRA